MTDTLFNILLYTMILSLGATFFSPKYFPKWSKPLAIIGLIAFLLLMLL